MPPSDPLFHLLVDSTVREHQCTDTARKEVGSMK